MFWIPVCAVVLLCYYIYSLVNAAQTGHAKNEFSKLDKISAAFRERVTDYDLEQSLCEKYDGKYSKCYEEICNFVGCKPDTAVKYPLINHWETMAKAIYMCKYGKIPGLMQIGALNDLIYEDNNIRAWHEKYLLCLESELQKAGVYTFFICECRTGDSKGYQHTPIKLRDFVKENGYGKTQNLDPIRFVQKSYYCVRYPEVMKRWGC